MYAELKLACMYYDHTDNWQGWLNQCIVSKG